MPDDTSSGTEVAQKGTKSRELSVYETFAEYARNRAALEGPIVAEELNTAQMAAILSATTEEELAKAMEMAGLAALKDLEDGTELRINGYHYALSNRADINSRLGAWVVIDAIHLATGERLALNTGVDRIIGFLRMVESGRIEGLVFPVDRVLRKIGTSGGNEMLTLKPLSPRVA